MLDVLDVLDVLNVLDVLDVLRESVNTRLGENMGKGSRCMKRICCFIDGLASDTGATRATGP